jgi:hypothetical protein
MVCVCVCFVCVCVVGVCVCCVVCVCHVCECVCWFVCVCLGVYVYRPVCFFFDRVLCACLSCGCHTSYARSYHPSLVFYLEFIVL